MVILVALFVERENRDGALQTIKDKFNIQGNKVFILEQDKDEDELIFTFNIEMKDDDKKEDLNLDEYGKLIRIHRKKETNTLYTINALNTILKDVDTNWDNYKYSFLTVSSGALKIIKTHLNEIVELDKI